MNTQPYYHITLPQWGGWILRTLLKGAVLAVGFALAWWLLSLQQISSPGLRSLVAFGVDTLLTFAAVTLAYTTGLVIHFWVSVVYLVRKARNFLLTRLLATLLVALSIVYVANQASIATVGTFSVEPVTVLNLWVVTSVAIATARRSYYLNGVLTQAGRNEFVAEEHNLTRWQKIRRAARISRPRDRAWAPWLQGLALTLITLALASSMTRFLPATLFPAVFGFSLCMIATVWGILRRLWDLFRPWGEREVMYPYWDRCRLWLKPEVARDEVLADEEFIPEPDPEQDLVLTPHSPNLPDEVEES